MTIEQTQQFIQGGQWVSIAPEIRPSIARNADGRGFDTEANRPANLQIPLVRK